MPDRRSQSLEERLEAIRRLLAHRHDHLPQPTVRSNAIRGFAGDRDPYRIVVVQKLAGHTGVQHDRRRALDAAIDRAGQLARDRPVTEADDIAAAEERDYGWVEARKAMYRDYDFAALEVALERLRFALPDVPPGSARGLRFIEPHMPDPVRAPAADRPPAVATFATLGERDRRIRELILRDGMPSQWVAGYVGLSVSQVNRIVNKEQAA